jgi:Cu(I)/Ag(I) efflux system membrane fusion protein
VKYTNLRPTAAPTLKTLVTVFALAAALGACSRREPPATTEAAAPGATSADARDATLKEHALAHAKGYVCPMHPDVKSDEPAKCPICGMDLVPVANAAPADDAGAVASTERRILYYRHPHKPEVTSPEPRQDEMGMDYLPVYADAGDTGATVTVDAGMRQALGVRTAKAERAPLSRRVEAVATVAFDRRGTREIRVRAEGWIEQLQVRAAGERVRKGQPLFTVYSPKLATTRQDLERARKLQDPELIAAAEARLRALGASANGGNRTVVTAPVDGVVEELMVLEGAMLTPDMVAARITPLGQVWVVAAVPESASGGLEVGATAQLQFAAHPGERLEARVTEILPELDMETRTVQARLTVANAETRLRAGMIGTASIEVGRERDVVQVPLEALIRTGRGERVVVALGDGRFGTREVVAGLESGDRVEIREGLAAGEEVVVSGQFLIDSESNVRSSLGRLETAPPPSAAAPAAAPGEHAAHGGTEPRS